MDTRESDSIACIIWALTLAVTAGAVLILCK